MRPRSALKTSLEPATGNSFYRIFRDENNLAVFAYELEVARTADGLNFRVTAKAATEAFATRFPNADGGKPTPTLSSPLESPLLNSGEKVHHPRPFQSRARTEPHRYGPDPAGPARSGERWRGELGADSFRGPESLHPRKVGDPFRRRRRCVGSIRHVLYPRTRRLFLLQRARGSAAVRTGGGGGRQASDASPSTMKPTIAPRARPILVHADRGQLWVYHDPNYKPAGNWTKAIRANVKDEYFTAASDSMQWWLRCKNFTRLLSVRQLFARGRSPESRPQV